MCSTSQPYLLKTKCAVVGCSSTALHQRLFRFPRQKERYQEWAEFSQNPKLKDVTNKRAFMCYKHFSNSQFRADEPKTLIYNAKPTFHVLYNVGTSQNDSFSSNHSDSEYEDCDWSQQADHQENADTCTSQKILSPVIVSSDDDVIIINDDVLAKTVIKKLVVPKRNRLTKNYSDERRIRRTMKRLSVRKTASVNIWPREKNKPFIQITSELGVQTAQPEFQSVGIQTKTSWILEDEKLKQEKSDEHQPSNRNVLPEYKQVLVVPLSNMQLESTQKKDGTSHIPRMVVNPMNFSRIQHLEPIQQPTTIQSAVNSSSNNFSAVDHLICTQSNKPPLAVAAKMTEIIETPSVNILTKEIIQTIDSTQMTNSINRSALESVKKSSVKLKTYERTPTKVNSQLKSPHFLDTVASVLSRSQVRESTVKHLQFEIDQEQKESTVRPQQNHFLTSIAPILSNENSQHEISVDVGLHAQILSNSSSPTSCDSLKQEVTGFEMEASEEQQMTDLQPIRKQNTLNSTLPNISLVSEKEKLNIEKDVLQKQPETISSQRKQIKKILDSTDSGLEEEIITMEIDIETLQDQQKQIQKTIDSTDYSSKEEITTMETDIETFQEQQKQTQKTIDSTDYGSKEEIITTEIDMETLQDQQETINSQQKQVQETIELLASGTKEETITKFDVETFRDQQETINSQQKQVQETIEFSATSTKEETITEFDVKTLQGQQETINSQEKQVHETIELLASGTKEEVITKCDGENLRYHQETMNSQQKQVQETIDSTASKTKEEITVDIDLNPLQSQRKHNNGSIYDVTSPVYFDVLVEEKIIDFEETLQKQQKTINLLQTEIEKISNVEKDSADKKNKMSAQQLHQKTISATLVSNSSSEAGQSGINFETKTVPKTIDLTLLSTCHDNLVGTVVDLETSVFQEKQKTIETTSLGDSKEEKIIDVQIEISQKQQKTIETTSLGDSKEEKIIDVEIEISQKQQKTESFQQALIQKPIGLMVTTISPDNSKKEKNMETQNAINIPQTHEQKIKNESLSNKYDDPKQENVIDIKTETYQEQPKVINIQETQDLKTKDSKPLKTCSDIKKKYEKITNFEKDNSCLQKTINIQKKAVGSKETTFLDYSKKEEIKFQQSHVIENTDSTLTSNKNCKQTEEITKDCKEETSKQQNGIHIQENVKELINSKLSTASANKKQETKIVYIEKRNYQDKLMNCQQSYIQKKNESVVQVSLPVAKQTTIITDVKLGSSPTVTETQLEKIYPTAVEQSKEEKPITVYIDIVKPARTKLHLHASQSQGAKTIQTDSKIEEPTTFQSEHCESEEVNEQHNVQNIVYLTPPKMCPVKYLNLTKQSPNFVKPFVNTSPDKSSQSKNKDSEAVTLFHSQSVEVDGIVPEEAWQYSFTDVGKPTSTSTPCTLHVKDAVENEGHRSHNGILDHILQFPDQTKCVNKVKDFDTESATTKFYEGPNFIDLTIGDVNDDQTNSMEGTTCTQSTMCVNNIASKSIGVTATQMYKLSQTDNDFFKIRYEKLPLKVLNLLKTSNWKKLKLTQKKCSDKRVMLLKDFSSTFVSLNSFISQYSAQNQKSNDNLISQNSTQNLESDINTSFSRMPVILRRKSESLLKNQHVANNTNVTLQQHQSTVVSLNLDVSTSEKQLPLKNGVLVKPTTDTRDSKAELSKLQTNLDQPKIRKTDAALTNKFLARYNSVRLLQRKCKSSNVSKSAKLLPLKNGVLVKPTTDTTDSKAELSKLQTNLDQPKITKINAALTKKFLARYNSVRLLQRKCKSSKVELHSHLLSTSVNSKCAYNENVGILIKPSDASLIVKDAGVSVKTILDEKQDVVQSESSTEKSKISVEKQHCSKLLKRNAIENSHLLKTFDEDNDSCQCQIKKRTISHSQSISPQTNSLQSDMSSRPVRKQIDPSYVPHIKKLFNNVSSRIVDNKRTPGYKRSLETKAETANEKKTPEYKQCLEARLSLPFGINSKARKNIIENKEYNPQNIEVELKTLQDQPIKMCSPREQSSQVKHLTHKYSPFKNKNVSDNETSPLRNKNSVSLRGFPLKFANSDLLSDQEEMCDDWDCSKSKRSRLNTDDLTNCEINQSDINDASQQKLDVKTLENEQTFQICTRSKQNESSPVFTKIPIVPAVVQQTLKYDEKTSFVNYFTNLQPMVSFDHSVNSFEEAVAKHLKNSVPHRQVFVNYGEQNLRLIGVSSDELMEQDPTQPWVLRLDSAWIT